ncbi:16S rRNA (guanine(966)-N(2))-methyltransferase RsmD [Aliivibrio salmonicida]|uniref:Ribosomal RNA small subunit methyltransferase D n=1 Tax=Aliivibrio salmonicida (strain LFI1238) TaxID=316275 RepID=B6ENV1_ALISL|nr:16S rRNA (guanine(966)-N(2))-methyltransferase RsmD [Aliivibrio salmonicida]AZL85977.1 16S rRNA (guanine(966)-N(2))-methyltransferase RsmD [Aliivibrio salmonicida]CAQ80588.1 conserved hypothetical protein [Aliivibrio salmonicida LFI1238]
MLKRKQHSSRTSNTNRASGSIRIISGRWRGRKLPVHDAEGLRPTTDRIKETVFNWLALDIPRSRCLDLFSGSGGLGFEAASRGAEHVVMLELNKQAHTQLKQNAESLKADNIELHHIDALAYLNQTPTPFPFDVVFIDPPFRKDLLEETLTKLEQNGWLTKNAMIYIEAEKELSSLPTPAHWRLHRDKTAGQVTFKLYEREE